MIKIAVLNQANRCLINFDRVDPNDRIGNYRGELLDIAMQMQNVLHQKIMVVDLGPFFELESSCIGILLLLRQEVEEKGGRFAIVGVNKRMHKILQQSGMDVVFKSYESLVDVPGIDNDA